MADGGFDEVDGGVLLKPEALADGVAGFNENRQTQRQIAFGAEFGDSLRLLVLDDLKLVFRQIGDETSLLILYGEQEADACDVDADRGLFPRICGSLSKAGKNK